MTKVIKPILLDETGKEIKEALDGIQHALGNCKGDKGDQGEKGDAFRYEDFTPEQLAALKGERGEKGDQGEKGEKGDTGLPDIPFDNKLYGIKNGGYEEAATKSEITELNQEIASKQEEIPDLPTIRSGAAKGATAVQPASLSSYATKTDLSNGLNTRQPKLTDAQLAYIAAVPSKADDSKLTELQLEVGELSDLETTDKTSIVNAINEVAQGGGGESGKRGVISQTLTWASDFSSYTLSNQVYGIIPQASIDLFLSAGAEFNDTQNPITKTAPWSEQVQHLPGCFYYAGIGDISYQEIALAYQLPFVRCGNADYNYYKLAVEKRARFNFTNVINTNGAFTSCSFFARQSYIENIVVCYGTNANVKVSSMSNFAFNSEAVNIIGIIDIKDVAISGDAIGTHTVEFRFINANKNVNLSLSYLPGTGQFVSIASILYMIQNSAATSPITITLHANAYARAIADAEIQLALEAHPLITLASA